MKKRILPFLIGAGIGGLSLLAFWLLGDVFQVLKFSFQDSAFILGLILFLLGLLALVKAGRAAQAPATCTPSNATAQMAFNTQIAFQHQKDMDDLKKTRREKGPSLSPAGLAMVTAGAIDLAAFGITLLF